MVLMRAQVLKNFCWVILLSISSLSAWAEDSTWPLQPKQAQSHINNDLHLGVFYYHYLNEDYQQSANQLNVLRQKLPAEDQQPLDIAEVTLLLALGIEQQAEQVFAQIKTSSQASSKAWLYLARRWLARGQWENADISALQSLQQPENLSRDEEQEALYILVISAIEKEEYHSARLHYDRMQKSSHWADLARYNLLVATVKSGASTYAVETALNDAVQNVQKSAEGKALRDRSYLLAGLYLLESGSSRAAEALFKKISQDSPYAAESLLFYGWALAGQSKYYDAIQPWRVLQSNYQDWHPAVIESIVAVPHTMEMMNATTQALRGYEIVEQQITDFLASIEQLKNEQVMSEWLTDWLQQQQGEWGWRRHQTVIEQSSMTQSLTGLISTTKFREQLSEYYDLYAIGQQLQQQLEQTHLWLAMVEQRRQHLQQADGVRRLDALRAQQQQLLERVDDLEQQWRAQEELQFSFLTPEQQLQNQRLNNVVEQIRYLQQVNTPTRNLNPYKERWRRNRGVYLWNTTLDQSAREWTSTREFWQLYDVLADMQRKLTHSGLALEWSASSWQGMEERIVAIQQRIQILQAQVNEQHNNQQQQLIADMTEHLTGFAKRLFTYQAHARLATARLYDDALQNKLISTFERQEREIESEQKQKLEQEQEQEQTEAGDE